MKKKLTAAFLVLALCLACVPLMSGCSASTDYTLKVDDNGNKYYVAQLSGYANSMKGEYEIPEYYGEGEDRAPVTEIAEQGFASTSLTKITVPKTVTKIGTASFAFNTYLKEVVFEDGINLEVIPHGTFGNCYSLEEIVIPESVKEISSLAFNNCRNLDKLALPSVETIGIRAFDGCSALEEVTLSETLTTIGEMAFYNSGLTSAVIPDSVKEIGNAAFYFCESLKLAVVGSGVEVIPCGAFGECPALTEVYLPAGLKEIKGAYFSETNNSYLFGHAFYKAPLTDLYFAGTEAEWTELKKNIDNKPVVQNGVTSDNGALFAPSLNIHYETKYSK